MTDRVRTITVVLERDMRTDDVQYVVDAIRMVRYVSHAEAGPVVDHISYAARRDVATKIRNGVLRVIREAENGE